MYYFQSWLNNNKEEKFYREAMLCWSGVMPIQARMHTAQQGRGARFYVHIWNTRTWYVRAVGVYYIDKVPEYCSERYKNLIVLIYFLQELNPYGLNHIRFCRDIRPLNISAYAQPAMKYIRRILSQRWNSFKITKYQRWRWGNNSLNWWNSWGEQAGISGVFSKQGQPQGWAGEIRGVLTESTAGAMGHGGTTVAFHGQFQV
jgi:hypothetical protein